MNQCDPFDAIIIGENLVDLLVRGEHVDAVVGGGPLNVARTLARLGARVQLASGVSGDAFGLRIRASLDEEEISLLNPSPAPEPTTLAVVTVTDSPTYHFHLTGTAAFNVTFDELSPTRVLYIGTLGLVVEPMASVSEAMFVSAPSSVLRVIDPNCRPTATPDVDQYRARVARCVAVADVVKVSVEDLDFLHPDLGHDEAASAMVVSGARLVLVTDADRPVRIVHADFRLTLDVPPVQVVDTVGAGDGFLGGFLAFFLERQWHRAQLDNQSAVRAAVLAGTEISSRTCAVAGANPPRRRELTTSEVWGPYSPTP